MLRIRYTAKMKKYKDHALDGEYKGSHYPIKDYIVTPTEMMAIIDREE